METISRFRPGRVLAASRRSWGALTLAVTMVAALSACSGGGPAVLAVRCTGHTLAEPDTADISANDVALAASPAAVAGVPHPAGAVASTGIPDFLDPVDPSLGYGSHGWAVVGKGPTGGPAKWSVTIRPPGATQANSKDADLSLQEYTGYVIAAGGTQGQDIAAVSDQGRAGPACQLPAFDASDGTVALLPHAGILITANPTTPSAKHKDLWLDGYSTTTGKRLWSIDTRTGAAEEYIDLDVNGDTVYIWQGQTGKVAAYTAGTGHQLWTTDSGTFNPIYPDQNLLGTSDGRVFALIELPKGPRIVAMNSTTGKIIWTRDVPEPVSDNKISISQVGTGLVAVAGAGNRDYLLRAASGTIISSLPVQSSAGQPQLCTVNGEPAVAVVENGALGVLTSDQAGNRTISIPPGKQVDVAVASTMAYVRAEKVNGPVYGYDLATGQRTWTVAAPGTQPEGPLWAFGGGFAVLEGLRGQGRVFS
jgi:outer membrane protein assembly factor BamB